MYNELTTFIKGYVRYIVKNWCLVYIGSQGLERCGVNVVVEEQRNGEKCGSMRHSYFPYFLRLVLTINHLRLPKVLVHPIK